MYSNDFETAFSQFLDGRDYDEGANYLFSVARAAFAAGWTAAGGKPPRPAQITPFSQARGKPEGPGG